MSTSMPFLRSTVCELLFLMRTSKRLLGHFLSNGNIHVFWGVKSVWLLVLMARWSCKGLGSVVSVVRIAVINVHLGWVANSKGILDEDLVGIRVRLIYILLSLWIQMRHLTATSLLVATAVVWIAHRAVDFRFRSCRRKLLVKVILASIERSARVDGYPLSLSRRTRNFLDVVMLSEIFFARAEVIWNDNNVVNGRLRLEKVIRSFCCVLSCRGINIVWWKELVSMCSPIIHQSSCTFLVLAFAVDKGVHKGSWVLSHELLSAFLILHAVVITRTMLRWGSRSSHLMNHLWRSILPCHILLGASLPSPILITKEGGGLEAARKGVRCSSLSFFLDNSLQTVDHILAILITFKHVKSAHYEFIFLLDQSLEKLNVFRVRKVVPCKTVHEFHEFLLAFWHRALRPLKIGFQVLSQTRQTKAELFLGKVTRNERV